MSISVDNGVIKGAKTRKTHKTEFDQDDPFTLFYKVDNTTSSKRFKKRRIWFRVQHKVARPNPLMSGESYKWSDIVGRTELCAGQEVSDTIDVLGTSRTGGNVNGVRVRLADFRIVVTRSSGSGKREYTAELNLAPS